MEKLYDMIIVGGGPAGYTAALYASRAGFDTIVLERLSAGGQMALTGDIDNYPGFEEGIDGFTLGIKMMKSAERFGALSEFGEVISLDLGNKLKKVICADKTYSAKTVVLAMGANPKKLGLQNEDSFIGRGIHYCAHCDGRFYKDKTVAVVGGGNSAVSDALYLSRLAKKVYLIHRRDSLRAAKIYHEPLMKCENVDFVWDSTVLDFTTDDGKSVTIQNLKTEETNKLGIDGLFVSIGREPATEFLRGVVATDKYGYIIADESTKTNIDGVYAIGDVRTKALRQVVTAVGDGAVAVHFAEEYLTNNE